MPITRTPIINDDGSMTVGTVFEDAWKQELYNQIDAFVIASIAGVNSGGITEPYSAAHYLATGGQTWTVPSSAVVQNRYTLIGNIMVWSLYLTATTLSANAQTLFVVIPGGRRATGLWNGVNRIAQIYDATQGNTEAIVGPGSGPGTNTVNIQKNTNQPWTGGSMPVVLMNLVFETM